MESGVEVEGGLTLVEERRLIEDRVVERPLRGDRLVQVRPVLDAVQGRLGGQVRRTVVLEQSLARGTDVEVEVAGPQHVSRSQGHGEPVEVIGFSDRLGRSGQLIPGRRNRQPLGLQDIRAVPHDLSVGVDGYRVGLSVRLPLGERRLGEAVAADGVDDLVERNQGLGVDHLHDVVGQRGGDVRHLSGGQSGGPLGVELGPGELLDLDGDIRVLGVELLGHLLHPVGTRSLGEGRPHGDRSAQRSGLLILRGALAAACGERPADSDASKDHEAATVEGWRWAGRDGGGRGHDGSPLNGRWNGDG